ncbi:MAG TPA: hypothetical protein VMV18_03370 [bacterium]|nr:hypothetical protein [bacterium]
MARKTTRKTNGSSRTSRTASSTNPAIQSAIEAGEVLRKRFETRLDDVRSRLQTFEKDWSKTVDTLVTRGRRAEKDLRTRLDKVTRELNANDILARVKKTPAFKVVKNSDLLDRVQDFDYEKTVAQLRKDVKGVQEEVLDFFQTSASRLKNVIDLPSRADFERLNKKIDHLSTQVRTLESRKSRRN